jgi:sterol desaturase/sphingolipid hydroxylase (fatty acid hydroxylase superfamily)
MIFYLLGLLSYYKIRNKPVPASICLLFFGVVTVPPTTTLFFLINKHWLFHAIAFAGGLFCWTFIEYFVHRFLMHSRNKEQYYRSDHFHHHTNPTKIFTGTVKRVIYTAVPVVFTLISITVSGYLLLPAGILIGFAMYINMHRVLHSRFATKWFGRLQRFHMSHHLGQTEKCFGVTFTWWDRLFNTAAVEKSLPAKKIEIFFNDTKEQKLIA